MRLVRLGIATVVVVVLAFSSVLPVAEAQVGGGAVDPAVQAASPSDEYFCGFLDNPWDGYFSEASCWLKEEGITTGTTSYNPKGDVTRGQMAAFLWRAAGSPAAPDYVFSDEAKIPSWARAGADWLKQQGITTVDPYRPGDPVTRAEMAAFLWRAAGSPAATNFRFADEAAIPAYARVATDWLKEQGITVNSPFNPNGRVSRAQMSAFLWRAAGRPALERPNPNALILWFDTSQGDRTVDIPLGAGNVTIEWGDGTAPQSTSGDRVVSHTYATAGYYRVLVTGSLDELGGFSNANNHSAQELVAVSQFGNLGLDSLGYAFSKAPNLTRVNQNLPASVDDLEGAFSSTTRSIIPFSVGQSAVSGSFRNYAALGEDISQWDTSGITDMSYMFDREETFNVDISGWDVSNVTNMERMFQNADAFQFDLNSWDVSSVTDMSFMFAFTAYNGSISGWNLSSLTTAEEMFSYAGITNDLGQVFPGTGRTTPIANWTFPLGSKLTGMFKGADMTGALVNWNVAGVTDMLQMFAGSPTFNQDLSGWDVSSVTDGRFFSDGAPSWVLPKPNFR